MNALAAVDPDAEIDPQSRPPNGYLAGYAAIFRCLDALYEKP
jgi:hypothetical protein